MTRTPTIHASAVMVEGHGAVLIRGPSGSGKSALAFDLILASGGCLPATTLIGDDRLHLERDGAEVIVRPAAQLAGLIEIRGLGIRRMPFIDRAPVILVVDLAAPDAGRLPDPAALRAELAGATRPRIPVESGRNALHMVVAALLTEPADAAHATKKALAEGDL